MSAKSAWLGARNSRDDTVGRRSSSDHAAGPVYSVVAPVFNEEACLPHFYQRVTAVMEELGEPYELVLVNDGSRDGSYRVLRRLHDQDARVRVVDLSRNFGHQIALSAGLDHARGEAVIVIDSDLQDPPEVIPEMVARWKAGAEVVYAQRRMRSGETRFKLLTASVFYRLMTRLTAVSIPHDTGDFRLLDRRVVDALVAMREHHRFMRGLSAWVGFRQEAVQYDRHERFAGTTKYPFRKMLRFSIDAITSFSHVPLQLATSFGFMLAGISLVGIVIAGFLRIVHHAIIGQASTLILVLFMGGIQLIFLGIIGEYLGRIYDEVRSRPLYIAREVLGDEEEPRRDWRQESSSGASDRPSVRRLQDVEDRRHDRQPAEEHHQHEERVDDGAPGSRHAPVHEADRDVADATEQR